MGRNLIGAVAVGSLWLGGLALAQDQAPPTAPAAGLPSAEDLFKKNVEASGGEAAMRATTSRIAVGRVTLPGASAMLTIASAAPDKLRVSQMMIGKGDVEQGYNGTVGWANVLGKVTILTKPEELAGLKESAVFYRDLDYKTLYSEAVTEDRVEWEGKSAYRVRYTATTGTTGQFYFDADTGLMYGNVFTKPGGTEPTTIVMSDFKDVAGVRYAMKVVQRSQGREITTVFDKVEANPETLPSFDPPAEVPGPK